MSNFGGKYSAFERDFNTRIKPLLKKLAVKEEQLQTLILSSIANPKKNMVYWNKLRTEINKMYADMNKMFASWSKEQIPSRYRTSLRQIQASIASKKYILNLPKKKYMEMVTSKTSYATQQLLYKEANEAFLTALNAGRNNMIRFTRATQQAILTEGQIESALASELLQSGNLAKATRALKGDFWKNMYGAIKEKQFIQAGRYRYKVGYYAEMVGRVKFHEAQSIASLHQASNYGTDLVQVSSHNTTTPICIPFEGKIYSVSGKSKLFPPLFDTPPYHPNCLHLLFPTFESAMEVQGTLDSFSAFSKGKIDRPPVPAGFVPISKRKVS